MAYIIYQTLFGDNNENAVIEEINNNIRMNEILESPDIVFHNEVLDTLEEAEKYLKSITENENETHAVRYKDKLKRSRAYKKACEHYEIAISKYEEIIHQYYFADCKRKEIECENCGSRLNLQYLKQDKRVCCPVCQNDLRPQVWFNKIQIAKDRVDYCFNKMVNMEKAQHNVKGEEALFWLVRYSVSENYL